MSADLIYRRVVGQTGWRRRGLAFLLGVLGAGAMAPLHGVFLLIPALTGLLWLIFTSTSARAAFAVGWWFGFGHFAAGLYWVANALLTFPDRFGWMAPLAVLGLAAVLAFFIAAAASLTRFAARHSSAVGRVVVFAATWTAFEWLRSWLLTGFPWNLLGSVWVFSDAMLQSAALAGVYGLSLLSVLVAAMPAVLAGQDGWAGRRNPLRPIGVVVAALVVVWAGGALRLAGATDDVVADVRLRLVQSNIEQKLKWDRVQKPKNFRELIRMSNAPPKPGAPPPSHVIWSETAATYFLGRDKRPLQEIARMTPKGGLTITGAPRTTAKREPVYRIWNSLRAIDDQARIVGTYDKSHLVPFGEYVPLNGLPGMSKLTAGSTDFSPGPGPTTLRLKGLPPVSPLICYEVIFPAQVVNARDRPAWLLNLTNDGWYGVSSGPYQHFAAARLRAVEEGLPLVRVANTGISGVIDGYGRVVASLGLGAKGVLDSDLPRSLKPTLYSRLGNWISVFLIVLMIGAGILMSGERREE